ncbi:MAG: hypothetical protein H5T66_00515 [Chloroflexi bacterium]|nr:hypothetical protein [Chloroflexota bacterium]
MRDDLKNLMRGAVIGALLGALVGLFAGRALRKGKAPLAAGEGARKIDVSRLLRLGMSFVGIVRQMLEL